MIGVTAGLLLAACTGSGDPEIDDGSEYERPVGQMHCGYWTASMDIAPTDFWAGVESCFLIRLFDADNGAPVDEMFTGRTEVRWYMPLPPPFTEDPPQHGGGDCLFWGIDEDGAANGWEAPFDGNNGVCRLGNWDTTAGLTTARGWAARSGSIRRTESGNWQVAGTARHIDYNFAPDAPLQGTVFEDFAGFAIEASPRDADYGWPVVRYSGHCPTHTTWTASDWSYEVLDDAIGGCEPYGADTVTNIGSQSYSLVDDGHGLPWSDGTTKKLVKDFDGCLYAGATDTNWVNAIDLDEGRVGVTYRGNVEHNGGLGWCEVSFTSPLVAAE